MSEQKWQCHRAAKVMMLPPLAMQNHWLPTQGLEQDPAHKGVRTALWDIILMTG